ncbi:hypothetical protein [Ornithobacterium rhinotracheale]
MKLLFLMLIKKLFPNNVVDFLSVVPFVFLAMGFYCILFFLISNRIFRNKSKNLFEHSDFFDISLYFVMIAVFSNVVSNLFVSIFFKKYQ